MAGWSRRLGKRTRSTLGRLEPAAGAAATFTWRAEVRGAIAASCEAFGLVGARLALQSGAEAPEAAQQVAARHGLAHPPAGAAEPAAAHA